MIGARTRYAHKDCENLSEPQPREVGARDARLQREAAARADAGAAKKAQADAVAKAAEERVRQWEAGLIQAGLMRAEGVPPS
jgi:hypothetical protein